MSESFFSPVRSVATATLNRHAVWLSCWVAMLVMCCGGQSSIVHAGGPSVEALPTTASLTDNGLTQSEAKSGWRMLFDGTDAGQWRNYQSEDLSDGWRISDGMISRVKEGAGDLVTRQQFKFFELSLDYKIPSGGNSGLMFHVAESEQYPWMTGPEVQILDNEQGRDPQKAGWLYQLYKPSYPSWSGLTGDVDATRPAGQWNRLYLRISPSSSEVCLNNVRYSNFVVGSDDWNRRVSESKFAGFKNFGKMGTGHICLQDHGDPVAFRNIKIREIDEEGNVPAPIDGQMEIASETAFPNLVWDGWEPVDANGKLRPMRLLELTFAADQPERLYAATQAGEIWTFENRRDVEESSLFLDMTQQVYDFTASGANEQGLLGIALHPKFAETGTFFTYHSEPSTSATVVTRWQRDTDNALVADEESGVEILRMEQPYQNHNGGSITFGPDGMLYVGVGDGGSANDPKKNGQNLQTLLGTVLRLDVDNRDEGLQYAIPNDNPFVDVDDARGEIFAYGLRNPWRLAFDPATDELWTADVGQELWEEINVIRRGGNYGWSVREASHPFNEIAESEPTILPVFEYDHQQGKSITGGKIYRADSISALQGKYIYADYVTGRMWALGYDASTGMATENVLIMPEAGPVLSYGQDADGEVYYMVTDPRGEGLKRLVTAPKVATK